MNFTKILAKEFGLREEHSSNIINLINEGNTIPFIARYRKEATGSCDDQVLREFAERLIYLTNLEKRKEEVKSSITEQGKWTEEIAKALEKAIKLTEVEDIYRPYKQKRKTRASMAIEKGLQPLADIMLAQDIFNGKIEDIAKKFINVEKGVNTVEDAIVGGKDIIAETVSDDAGLRKLLREYMFAQATISTKLLEKEKSATYEMYKEYDEKVATIPSHRILAINRGEKEECLKVAINIDSEIVVQKVINQFLRGASIWSETIKDACADSYKRLIFPSIEREIRSELSEKAYEQAIRIFEQNLKPLLLQPPLKDKVVLALDPAYRTGCKVAVVDGNSNLLATDVVYPTPPQSRVEEAERKLLVLINKHDVDVISIGNGTASKETEIFTVGLIKKSSKPLSYMVVNEAGASVYSASKLGAEEFPELDVSLRSAVSIGRRLQDPLAELIKIDVKSIGVGQYQHDLPQKRLTQALGGVVEDCVNSVGVDLNTASASLLTYVAGLNNSIAKNIVEYRKLKRFENRKELLKIPKLGKKAFEQSAGFLRIAEGKNLLDNTSVHPESYKAVESIFKHFNIKKDDIAKGKLTDIYEKIKTEGFEKIAKIAGVGVPTLRDIAEELRKPGRDIRDGLPAPMLRKDLMELKDLKAGMEIEGTVRNVIDFGAFVDIGVHQDGLVHISEICNRYIKHPSEELTVGDRVKVRVLSVDIPKKRIALSMKEPDGKRVERDFVRQHQSTPRMEKPARKEAPKDMATMLDMLKSKYSKH